MREQHGQGRQQPDWLTRLVSDQLPAPRVRLTSARDDEALEGILALLGVAGG